MLRNRCTVERNTPTFSGGESTPSWATLAENVPCLVQEKMGQTRGEQPGQLLEYDAEVYFLDSQDIRPSGSNAQGDRITLTNPSTGVVYLLLKAGDRAGVKRLKTAYARRLRG